MMSALSCGNKKAVSLLAELEQKAGLIERKRQGLGKPNLIYVKNFTGVYVDKSVNNYVDSYSQKCQKDTSGSVERPFQEVSERHGNNTDLKETDSNDTDLFSSFRMKGRDSEGIELRRSYEEYFGSSLDMCIWFRNIPMRQKALKRYLDFWLIPAVRPGS
ncbi:MAG: hypothetical protein V8Q57_03270 [Blautia sp.]